MNKSEDASTPDNHVFLRGRLFHNASESFQQDIGCLLHVLLSL